MEKTKVIRKTIIILLKIALAVFLVVLLNAIFMPKYINENQDGRITSEYYREKLGPDVIFAGSSTVYSGISPLILYRDYGITSYLRSNASQPLWITYYMVKDSLRAKEKPKLVVVDVGFAKYEDDYVEEPSSRKALDGMRLSQDKIDCIKETMGEDEKMSDYLFPLFRFHSRWKELTFDDFKYALYKEDVTYNGHIMNMGVEPMQIRRLTYDEREFDYLGSRSVYYLQKIKELCDNNDIPVLFIKMPGNYENWATSYDVQILDEVCEGAEGGYINFDNLSDVIGLDYYLHTPDGGQHLNTIGAEVFSEYLGKLLKEYYSLPDRRTDGKYVDTWQKKLDRYEKDKAAMLSEIE